ncbi:MAG: hypothetical protein ACOX7A_03960 [Lawsonibacter sp.]
MSTMENWGVIFCGHDKTTYSMYSHGLRPSICEVQYQFYNEEIALAEVIGVGCLSYKYEMFFSRRRNGPPAGLYPGADEQCTVYGRVSRPAHSGDAFGKVSVYE